MPALGKYDPLDHQFASKQDIEAARLRAESLVTTSKGKLQFDALSRQRMGDALRNMDPTDPNSVVSWRMADNGIKTMTHAQFSGVISEAELAVGSRSNQVFERSLEFKRKLSSGSAVTLRDIDQSNW